MAEPSQGIDRVERILFESLPSSSAPVALAAGVTAELAALKDAVGEAEWRHVEEVGRRCLGLGRSAGQALVDSAAAHGELYAEIDAARAQVAGLLVEVAQEGDAAATFAAARDALADQPDLLDQLEGSIELLEQGITENVPLLETLTAEHAPAAASAAALVRDAAVAGLSRGLLAVVHARVNRALALAEAAPSEDAQDEERQANAFEGLVTDFDDGLRERQLAVREALLAGSDPAAIDAADGLARWLESTLPRLGGAQGRAHVLAAALRARGLGGAAEALGRVAAEAGRLTRTGLASHAAAASLGLGLQVDSLAADVEPVRNVPPETPFAMELPNGTNTEIAHVDQSEDGAFVELQGLVTELEIGRQPDGKLISRLTLLDASSGAAAKAVAIFVHLRHAGVTGGSFCRLNGTVRHSSALAEGERAIEIDALPVSQLAEESWLATFLRSAEPWYEVWRNRANMWWSLGPHRQITDADPNAAQGAGELLFRPFVRRRGAEP